MGSKPSIYLFISLLFLAGCGQGFESAGSSQSSSTNSGASQNQQEEVPQLTLPPEDTDGFDHIITNYVDLNFNRGGMADYTGATGNQSVTYDGHRGVDIAVPHFGYMDAGTRVLAAESGVVTRIVDGEPDRNMITLGQCPAGTRANRVEIRAGNGYTFYYLHFKSGSIAVNVGDTVSSYDYTVNPGQRNVSYYYWTSLSNRRGQWAARVLINGVLAGEQRFQVN